METRVFHGLKLISHCGGGAYGEVYYGEDITAKKMAVKIISKKKLGNVWERELRGVKNYRKITENAPDLLRIFHVEDDEDSFFYTMEAADPVGTDEYVPDTLARRLQSGPLPPEELYPVLRGIFNGILMIHRAGFAHRDIKPDNILFVGGVPKLADIGLLSPLSATMTQLAGTLDFLPPEALSADHSDSSDHSSRQRNDLYAFGKVIYCAVTGMNPKDCPHPPADLPMNNLPVKYFFRLALRLCQKDPALRLDSIDLLEREFKEIDRILACGETLADRFLSTLRHSADYLRSACRFLRRFWYLALLFLLLGGTVTYQASRDPEDPMEQYKLARKYIDGNNAKEGVKWLRTAAKNGFAKAQYDLAMLYKEGKLLPEDKEKAKRWFERAAVNGIKEAMIDFAECCYATEEYDKAFEWTERAANEGHADAQYRLGECYEKGYPGKKIDLFKAKEWYEKSAMNGNKEAQYRLGTFYVEGRGVRKDFDTGFAWVKRAAENGHAKAQYDIGQCYALGAPGVPKDMTLALECWYKSASQNCTYAQYDLGRCYETGNGVPQDIAQAIRWYRRAAQQKDKQKSKEAEKKLIELKFLP